MGVSFLTPLASLLGLAALVPLCALAVIERRSARLRRSLGAPALRRRAVVPIVAALLVLPGLVAVAAAQPVIVRQKTVQEQGDVESFFVFDTSLSMAASAAGGAPSRLARAKAFALALRRRLPDVPVGIASMTDRTLPNLLPTTDAALFERTLSQSVAVDEPPPSEPYRGRGTSLAALPPIDTNNFYSPGVRRRLLVVFTDGETTRLPLALELTLQPGRETAPIFVHVWSGSDQIRGPGGRVDPAYRPDPASALDLARYASLTGGRVFGERSLAAVAATAKREAGHGRRRSLVSGYARIALAPWFVVAALAPLAFVLWKRNL